MLFLVIPPPPSSTLFPYTTLFRSIPSNEPVPEQRAFAGEIGRRVASALSRLSERERAAFVLRHRSEEHTSELQSRFDLVCRLLLEKKNLAAGGGNLRWLAETCPRN